MGPFQSHFVTAYQLFMIDFSCVDLLYFRDKNKGLHVNPDNPLHAYFYCCYQQNYFHVEISIFRQATPKWSYI